jgi:hypothetical protein
MVNSPSDVTVSKIEFSPVKMLDNGCKTVTLRYEGRNLMVETPSLNVPYGVNVFDKTGPPKYSVDLSLRGVDEDEKVKALQTFLEEFDEMMLDAGVANAGKWFKMTNPNREVIKAFYTPLLKYSRDQQGNLKPYPPTVKLTLRRKKDAAPGANSGAFETAFYNPAVKDAKGVISQFPVDMPIEQVLCKRSQATAIIQCTGVWFAGGKFGTTWKAVQVRVDEQGEQIRGPAFKSDAPDIRAFVSKGLPAKAAGSGAGAGYGGEDVEDDDDAEDEETEVLAAVVPQPKAAVKVVAAPAPAAAFEEEAVAEPIPVPKKVIKKTVTKAAPKA